MTKKELEKLQQYYRTTFGSEAGQKVLEDIRKRSGFDKTMLPLNEFQLALATGERNLFVYINKRLKG